MSTPTRYFFAIALVAVVTGLSLIAPALRDGSPFTLYFLAAIVMARLAGMGPAWLAIGLGGLAVQYFCIPPRFSLRLADPAGDVFRLAGFLVVSGLGAWITSSLRDARLRTEQILDSISEGFTVIDREWRCVYANRQAAELIRRRREDLMGRRLAEIFPDFRRAPFYEEARRAMEERKASRIEAYIPDRDAWYDADLMPTGQGLSVFVRDITDRKRGELRLEKTLADVVRSNRELERFASSVSHDWVQPLSTIVTLAELVRSKSMGDVERHAERIADVVMRMNDLLQARRNGTRPSSGAARLEPTSMAAVLDDVCTGLGAALAGAGLDVVTVELPTVTADPALLHQLWHSLMIGLLRYAAGHPGTLRVDSRAEQALHHITLRLTPGESPPRGSESAHDLDDAFAIARAIVELMGGSFETATDANGNPRVTFTLNAAPSKPLSSVLG